MIVCLLCGPAMIGQLGRMGAGMGAGLDGKKTVGWLDGSRTGGGLDGSKTRGWAGWY